MAITDSTFTLNSGYYGGAIRLANSNAVSITGSEFVSNTGNQGGAIHASQPFSCTNTRFLCNTDSGSASDIYSDSTGTFTATMLQGSCSFSEGVVRFNCDGSNPCTLLPTCTLSSWLDVQQSCVNQGGSPGCVHKCLFVADCPTTDPQLHNTSTGQCDTSACSSRAVSDGCSSPYDSSLSPCYIFTEGSSDLCVADCPGSHFKNPDSGNTCVMKDCSAREFNSTATYACGTSDCHLQVDTLSCDTTCPTDSDPNSNGACECKSHYVKGEGNVCVSNDCASRSYDSTTTFPCGENTCYLQIDGVACNVHCPSHYTPDTTTGRCSPTDCELRTYNGGDSYPCGKTACADLSGVSPPFCDSGCYIVEGGSCASACSSAHYDTDNTPPKTCNLLSCNARARNDSASFPCGSANCFVDIPSGVTTACASTCTNSEHYEESPAAQGESEYKHCVLKNCAARTPNGSSSPCGNDECYVDTFVGLDKCNTVCTNSAHYYHPAAPPATPADSKKCKLYECTSRIDNRSSNDPCGKLDGCFLDTNRNPSGECVENCFNSSFYEKNTADGTCSIRPCASRTAMPLAEYPCATADCFYNPHDLDKCDDNCAYTDHYQKNTDTGVCVLKGCTSRVLNRTNPAHPLPCGSTDCFLNENGVCSTTCVNSGTYITDLSTGECILNPNCEARSIKDDVSSFRCGSGCLLDEQRVPVSLCVKECFKPEHYKDDLQGKCVLKECSTRGFNDLTPTSPCGDGCYWDSRVPACTYAGSCKYPGLYVGDSATGVCALRLCEARQKENSAPLPCGPSCFLDTGDTCTLTCTGASEGNTGSGECVSSSCSSISPSTSGLPCDPDPTCFLYPETGKCTSSCPSSYQANTGTGKCTLIDCIMRTPDSFLQQICGVTNSTTKCFLDTDGTCQQSCSYPQHYYGDFQTGACKLQSCSLRRLDTSSALPCGSSDCFLDVNNADPSSCTEQTCTLSNLYEGNSATGKCELKDCDHRVKINSEIFPCGKDDGTQTCFLDPQDGDKCVTACSQNDVFEGNDNTGLCSYKANCGLIISNPNAGWPCKSPACFLDPNNGNLCVDTTGCKHPEHFSGNPGTGKCQLKSICTDRTPIVDQPDIKLPCNEGCFYDRDAGTCVASCSAGFYANQSTWACAAIQLAAIVRVGGTGADDTTVCGAAEQLPCATLAHAYGTRSDVTDVAPTLALVDNVAISNSLFITGGTGLTIKAESSSPRPTLRPDATAYISIRNTGSANTFHVAFEQVDFDLVPWGITATTYAPLLNVFTTTLALTDVAFLFRLEAPEYALVSLRAESVFTLTNVAMNRIVPSSATSFSSSSSLTLSAPMPSFDALITPSLSPSPSISNAGDGLSNVCLSHGLTTLLYFLNSRGTIAQSSFTHSGVTVAFVSGGELNVVDTVFAGNTGSAFTSSSSVSYPELFPELRYNIYAEGGARVILEGVAPENVALNAYWVSLGDVDTYAEVKHAGVALNGEWLFVPELTKVEVVEEDDGTAVNLTLHGTLLMPCNLQLVVVRRPQGPDTPAARRRTHAAANVGEDDVVAFTGTLHPDNGGNLLNSKSALISLPRHDVFNPVGEYYVYITYGVQGLFRTAEHYVRSGDGFVDKAQNSGGFPAWIIIVVVLSVVAVCAGVVAFVIIRWRRQKKEIEAAGFDTTMTGTVAFDGDQAISANEHHHIPASGKEKRVTLFEGGDAVDEANPIQYSFGTQVVQEKKPEKVVEQMFSEDVAEDGSVVDRNSEQAVKRDGSTHEPLGVTSDSANSASTNNTDSSGKKKKKKKKKKKGTGTLPTGSPVDSDADISRADQANVDAGADPGADGDSGRRNGKARRDSQDSDSDSDSGSDSGGSSDSSTGSNDE